MIRRTQLAACLFLVGCGWFEPTPQPTEPLVDTGARTVLPEVSYTPFDVGMRSMGAFRSTMAVSLTDTSGNIACQMSMDPDQSPGVETSQLLVLLRASNGFLCTDLSVAVPSDCPPQLSASSFNTAPDGCAYYREYDAVGNLSGERLASAGAVVVTAVEDGVCAFEVDLVFDGVSMSDAFTLESDALSLPWCL